MRRVPLAVTIVLVVAGALVVAAGELLSAPARSQAGAPPPELKAESIALASASGGVVKGWFSPGLPGHGAVLLLHGIRSNRSQMIERAKFLHRAGYSVMLIDLPAHGESAGSRITFGFHEAGGVQAAIAFIRGRLPLERLGVLGVSLGAASFVLSQPPGDADAVILESMYPTIEEAVANRMRMRLGGIGSALAPALLVQLPLRLGIPRSELQPIERIGAVRAPLLVVSGELDEHTAVAETERLFRAAREPKELWIVHGAAHVDLHRFNPAAYEARVSAFFLRYLRNPG